MPSGVNIVRFERAEDDLGVEWRRRGAGDSSFVPYSRRIRLPANDTGDDILYFPD